jgi:F420-0:gamma-glutamyl ligase-like protein
MIVTFISIHFVIICDVLLWRTYETHSGLSHKSGCDISPVPPLEAPPTPPRASRLQEELTEEILTVM